MLGKLRYVEIEAKVERATVVGARFECLRLRQGAKTFALCLQQLAS
jgi:hypothetical protein